MKRLEKVTAIMVAAMLALTATACSGGSAENPAGGGVAGDSGKKESSGEPITLKIAHGASETYHLHRALLKFKEIAEQSGRFTVEIYPAQQFGSDGEMIEGVKTGDLTMAVSPSSYLTDECPSMSLIELPYVYPNREAALAALNGDWGKKELALLEEAGLHGLGYLENGMRHVTNSKKEVHLPADLNGMKMRTMQVEAHVDFWNSLGCSAEGSPFSELYTNLSTGVFDGEENPIAHIYAQKFYEVQKYITLTEHVYCAYIPLMTTDFWNGLSAEEQKILDDAFAQTYAYQMELVETEEAAQLEEMEAAGCIVTRLTEQEKQAFIDAAQPTLERYREKVGADVYDEFVEAVKNAAAVPNKEAEE